MALVVKQVEELNLAFTCSLDGNQAVVMIVFNDAATARFFDLVEIDAKQMFTVGDMSKPLLAQFPIKCDREGVLMCVAKFLLHTV